MRIAAWNLNHRARLKAIPTLIGHAIGGVGVDTLVLTEFVDGPGRGWFRACLDQLGFGYQAVPHSSGLHNQVLVASRVPFHAGDIAAPTVDGSAGSNFLHVVFASAGLELIGLRVPAYKRARELRTYTTQLASVLDGVEARPLVVAGDFNRDPFSGASPHVLAQTPWRICPTLYVRNPDGDWSYTNSAGTRISRIDHVAHAPGVLVTEAAYIRNASFGDVPAAGIAICDDQLVAAATVGAARRAFDDLTPAHWWGTSRPVAPAGRLES